MLLHSTAPHSGKCCCLWFGTSLREYKKSSVPSQCTHGTKGFRVATQVAASLLCRQPLHFVC